MELQTVTEVSRALDVSTRMLRYYEQTGLITSTRRPGYAYRMYDEEAIRRLQQILLLRKLRIPVRQIRQILQTPGSEAAIEVFRQNMAELDREMDVLSAIRDILARLVERLQTTAGLPLHPGALDDDDLLALAALPSPDNLIREDKLMEDMKTVNESQPKLTDVRIVYLPPATVAASHHVGDDPELHAGDAMNRFVKDSRLWEKKPNLRTYGFNHPNPPPDGGTYGYEFWVTIPDDMDVPAPLVKKQFGGGVFAAHAIQMGNFQEWGWLDQWVRENGRYVYSGSGSPENMFGSLEEHLNYINHVRQWDGKGDLEIVQLDLLIPVRDTGDGATK